MGGLHFLKGRERVDVRWGQVVGKDSGEERWMGNWLRLGKKISD